MKNPLFSFLLILVFVVQGWTYQDSPTKAPKLAGRYLVEFQLEDLLGKIELKFKAQAKGSGSFLLLTPRSNLQPPATPTPAVYTQIGGEVSFSSEVVFPLGNCCQLPGTLVFKGVFDSPETISGKVIFISTTQDEKGQLVVRVNTGSFTAKPFVESEKKE